MMMHHFHSNFIAPISMESFRPYKTKNTPWVLAPLGLVSSVQ